MHRLLLVLVHQRGHQRYWFPPAPHPRMPQADWRSDRESVQPWRQKQIAFSRAKLAADIQLLFKDGEQNASTERVSVQHTQQTRVL